MKKGTLVRVRKGKACHITICVSKEAMQAENLTDIKEDFASHFKTSFADANLQGMVLNEPKGQIPYEITKVLFQDCKIGWIFTEILEILQCPESIPA